MRNAIAPVGALLLSSWAAAQCPPLATASAPFQVPLAAGSWSVQHFGRALQPGQIDFVVVGLPMATPIPLTALRGAFCNPVGNTPCWYADPNSVTWFALGPNSGVNTTVTITWPQQPWVVGLSFVAHFGIAGCVGPAPDELVLIHGQIN